MNLIGTKAPMFTAPAVIHGDRIVLDFSLHQFLGKKEVVLFFYPKDFTFVCPTELLSFQKYLPEFVDRNVAVLGCSTDTEETHRAWMNTPRNRGGIEGITYPLIADTSKMIAKSYGVLGGDWHKDDAGELVFSGIPIACRSTFLIDQEGIIRYAAVHDFPLGRSVHEILRLVDMWKHVRQFGEVCPVNWKKGDQAFQPTSEAVAQYLAQVDLL